MFAWFANLEIRWKVLFAPGFMILILAGIGLYAWHEQLDGRDAISAVMNGPVNQAQTVGDFTQAAWAMQVHLYSSRLDWPQSWPCDGAQGRTRLEGVLDSE